MSMFGLTIDLDRVEDDKYIDDMMMKLEQKIDGV